MPKTDIMYLQVTPSNIFGVAYVTGRDILELAVFLYKETAEGRVASIQLPITNAEFRDRRRDFEEAERFIANARYMINEDHKGVTEYANSGN